MTERPGGTGLKGRFVAEDIYKFRCMSRYMAQKMIDRGLRWFKSPGKVPKTLATDISLAYDREIEILAESFRCSKSAAMRAMILAGLERPPATFPELPKDADEPVSARVEPELWRAVARLAKERGVERQWVITALIAEGFKRLGEEEDLYGRVQDNLAARLERIGLREKSIDALFLFYEDLAVLDEFVKDLERAWAKKAGAEKGKAR
jgi:hypothetical protein